MYIFLDESGDLGFDFTNRRPSRFLIITMLTSSNSKLINKVRRKKSHFCLRFIEF